MDEPPITISRSNIAPSARVLLGIDEVDELRFAAAELAQAYRRGGAPIERIQRLEDIDDRLQAMFTPQEWSAFSERRWRT